MDSDGATSSSFDSFKSKEVPRSSVDKQHSDKALGEPDQSLWSFKTPEKPINPPRRPLTRRQTLWSVRQVREAAKQLRRSDLKPSVSSDPLTSSATSSETPITKSKTIKALPERFELLDEFFNSFQFSIRILRLNGSRSTFTNIRPVVERLTRRRFTHRHLAQLKFILPEGIEIRKIFLRDDYTSCMKPELYVTLNFSIIQDDEKVNSANKDIPMRKLFRNRLVSYFKSNPKGDEVPEEMLPEPFNKSSSNAMRNPDLGSVKDTVSDSETHPLIAASHMAQSFKRRFSKQVSDHSSTKEACEPITPSPITLCSKLPETPIKSFQKEGDVSSMDGTPATPILAARPPVRGFMTPDEDSVMSPTKSTPSKLTRGSSVRRLFETPVKNVKRASSSSDDDDDILSGDLFASIKEKERKAISQAKWRKQMIARLPKLFDSLLFIFLKRSVITKEELIHTIISCRMEIVDRREVEEQLRLLQELAPEWIYQTIASSGDLLFCVNKISSPESIRTRLSEAS